MKDQVADNIKTQRSNQLIEIGAKMSEEFRKYYLGKEKEVLFEEEANLNGVNYYVGYTKEYIKQKFDEIVEFSELEEFLDVPIKNFSSGMIARLGFSIATLVRPDILIVDEILF